MALATAQDLKDAVRRSYALGPGPLTKTTSLVFTPSLWTFAGPANWPAGATPATGSGETVDRTTTGAYPIPLPVGGKTRYLMRAKARLDINGGGLFMVLDRLVQTSGLVENTTAAQTVNSVALPARATGGDEVWMGVECYATPGTAAANLSVSYTNQAGTSGRTSQTVAPPTRSAAFQPIALAAGDTGVQSVQSVTIGTATAGAAGNLGITLYRPICLLYATQDDDTQQPTWGRDWGTLLHPIADDACLSVATLSSINISGPNLWLDLGFGYA